MIEPLIKLGNANLILNESIVFDSNLPLSLSIPTAKGIPFIFNFKIISIEGHTNPSIVFSKNEIYLVEVTATFSQANGGQAGLTHKVPINIAGSSYEFLFMISKLIQNTYRIEISIYEGSNV